METIIASGIVIILGFLIWDKFFGNGNYLESQTIKKMLDEQEKLLTEKSRLEVQLVQKTERMGEVLKEVEELQKENATLTERGKQAWAQNTKLEEKNSHLLTQNETFHKKLTKLESEKEQQNKEFSLKIEKLENAEKKFEEEKMRIRREDEERIKLAKENHDRLWNEHENMVAEKMRDSCRNPNLQLNLFDNKNLPENFDDKLKPDFLIEFLDQFIIFDAKKSKDINHYLTDQAKKTASKYKGKTKIFNMIFFIVPSGEMEKLKKTTFFEEGFSFFAITLESIEPVLFCFKKILEFENLENFDPQDREGILQAIANFEFFIRNQNAANILIAQKAIETMQNSKNNLKEETFSEIENRTKKMRPLKLKDSEMKGLVKDTVMQKKAIDKLTNPPKVAVSQKDLQQTANTLFPE